MSEKQRTLPGYSCSLIDLRHFALSGQVAAMEIVENYGNTTNDGMKKAAYNYSDLRSCRKMRIGITGINIT